MLSISSEDYFRADGRPPEGSGRLFAAADSAVKPEGVNLARRREAEAAVG
jgi:hypothetical protein